MSCARPGAGECRARGRVAVRAALLGLVLAAGGCATLHEGDCVRFEQIKKETRYQTDYAYDERETGRVMRRLKPLPHPQRAAAPVYELGFDRHETLPCSHLVMRKTLFLQRTAGDELVFEEVREFYTDKGARIAQNRENLTSQLATDGYYTARVPLPVPAGAPAGQYRVVSKLVLKIRGGRNETVLAQSSASFRVLPPKKKETADKRK